MYEQHFNFTSLPFSIAPNPRFVYLSPQHREALAHLLYGISAGGGFIALTGEVGTGKTTLCRCLLEQLPEDVDLALIFTPRLNAKELLAALCDELRIPHPEHRISIKQLIDRLNRHLLETHARGRRTVVLIDEAQNLSYDVLEQIRLLTNLETNETKLLQIILVGQPELKALLDRPNLRQLAQRITARYHLNPLSRRDTESYIQHRLAVSGVRQPLFNRSAVALIYRRSGGIPRLINLICDRALLGAYTQGKFSIGPAIVRKAAREVLPETPQRRWTTPILAGIAGLLGLLALLQFFGEVSVAAWIAEGKDAWDRIASGDVGRSAMVQASSSTPASPSPSTAAQIEPPILSVSAPGAAPPPIATPMPATKEAKSAAPTPVATPAPPPPPPFADLIHAAAMSSRSAAWARLIALWGIHSPSRPDDGCPQVRQHGLRCLKIPADWHRLQMLDHPALLEFTLPGNAKAYGVLKGLSEKTALLDLGGNAFPVDLTEMMRFRQSDAVILWKPPFDKASIGPGDQAESIAWVRRCLGLAAGEGSGQAFDLTLKQRVIAFQAQQGLPADGRIGPLTLLHLQRLAPSPDTPRLSTHHD